jgi:CRISPR-associated protein Csx10
MLENNLLDNNFKIKLEMLSDWQVGTGAGIPGGIDELISKDVDGFLQVPAKTLVGIWRDALERLTLGLDNGETDSNKFYWQKWVEVIFGNQPNEKGADPTKTPVTAILSIQPARISENLRAKIGKDKRLKQALTFTKVGVKINPDSGTSETEALRFEEMGRIGTVLEAEFELDWDYFTEEQKEIAQSLLVLSAKLVERIGGKRRRGAGKCCLKVFDKTEVEKKVVYVEKIVTDAKTTIELNKTENIQVPIKLEKTKEYAKIEEPEKKNAWQTCEYTLTLETPVSIVTAVLGNVSETLDFIPGTYLINHFVKHFGQNIFEAIQKNNFQISSATICIDGNRSFPVPKVFAKEKMKQAGAEKEEVYNRLLETLEGKKQTKPIRDGYISDLTSNKVLHATTPQTILMHNAVDDEVQRPTTDVVGVYSREAIKAGTILKGEIRFKNLQFDCSKLNGKVRIGTSKKDGGLAEIKVTKKVDDTKDERTFDKKLIVYLASDVMLRNGSLRQTNLVEDLAEALGLKGETPTFRQIQVRRIESWQVGWGFPRPTLTLMQAGSVVVFKPETEITLKTLQEIEKCGIGERRGEGYGQVIFNPPILEKKGVLETGESEDLKLEWKNADATKAENLIGNGVIEEIEFAKIIEETAWREEIKLAVSKIAADDVKKEKASEQIFGFKGLNMSQIGGLRSVIMRLQSKDAEERKKTSEIVTNWLKHLEKTPNRKDKWGDERIEKVRCVLKDYNIWEKLKPHFHYPKSLELDHNLKDELWAEAVKSLFYACQHAHKRDTEDK